MWKFLRKLFEKPRCDMEVCENPQHGRVHIQNSGRAYVPMNKIIESLEREWVLKEIESTDPSKAS
jgi:hypothetical protein